ncbi:MAG: tetratricopeptide repeat protein [Saprospiraceae bacterium]|jgi:tetratricopeptide (TPR) repeat protein|nr:tetratricopeptide repeat protein [Saprospiraceae bacterium]
MRIYDDLTRSGLLVWRYEKDSKKGINYQDEYLAALRAADYFCLLDSPHARASREVQKEIREGWKKFSRTGCFLVCLVAKSGEWRKGAAFTKITYFDLAPRDAGDTFDQHGAYEKAIGEMVQKMGRRFVSWAFQPWVGDLEAEFFHTVPAQLSVQAKEILLADFKSANFHWQNGELEKAESRLSLLANEHANLRLISPGLLLAAVYFDGSKIESARETYDALTKNFPYDPRTWFGLGLAAFHCRDFDSAAKSFNRALNEIDRNPDNIFHQEAKPNVLINLATTFLQSGRFHEAEKCLACLPGRSADLPEARVVKTLLLLQANEMGQAQEIFQTFEHLHSDIEKNPTHINSMLADLNARFASRTQGASTIFYLQRAVCLQPQNIQYWAQLALQHHYDKNPEASNHAAQQAIQLPPQTDYDRHFRGLAYFLKNNREMAKADFEASKSTGFDWYGNHIFLE